MLVVCLLIPPLNSSLPAHSEHEYPLFFSPINGLTEHLLFFVTKH